LPFTWTGLTNDVAYTFTVTATAHNSALQERPSPESLPSSPVTPKEW
jgi:hypothetical protein